MHHGDDRGAGLDDLQARLKRMPGRMERLGNRKALSPPTPCLISIACLGLHASGHMPFVIKLVWALCVFCSTYAYAFLDTTSGLLALGNVKSENKTSQLSQIMMATSA